jgi:hypothetical protein
MKRLVFIILSLVLFQSTAFAIGAAYSGTWYNPDESGHGFSLEYSELIESLIVFRDSGGLDNVGAIGLIEIETGLSADYFQMFDSPYSEKTNYTLQFNTQGSAQGYWNYENGVCYGEWSFTKD